MKNENLFLCAAGALGAYLFLRPKKSVSDIGRLTSNRREVIDEVQSYLLDWVEDQDYKGRTPEEKFVNMVDFYLEYQTPYSNWGNPYNVMKTLAEDGNLSVYYDDVRSVLESWGISTDGLSNVKIWNLYIHLIARDGDRLYRKLTR